jgi:uncharacterized spore protein YtfJ
MKTEKKGDHPTDTPLPSAPLADVTGMMEKLLEAAAVSKVYGEPIRHGDTLLLPAAEVLTVAGFGLGSGSGVAVQRRQEKSRGGGGGGGGGGRILARSVAVIVASPEGVRVKPVLDFTKIALAALTAAGFVAANWKGMARPRKLFRT